MIVLSERNAVEMLQQLNSRSTFLEGRDLGLDFGCLHAVVVSARLGKPHKHLNGGIHGVGIDIILLSETASEKNLFRARRRPKKQASEAICVEKILTSDQTPSADASRRTRVFPRFNENPKVKHNIISLIWTSTSVRSPQKA